jgi:hypothetical protein
MSAFDDVDQRYCRQGAELCFTLLQPEEFVSTVQLRQEDKGLASQGPAP